MTKAKISAELPYQSHFVDIYGSKMHYLDEGGGDPVLFLHGMPTSCYVWRNIFPYLSGLGRCIAPDLIGMGKSDKPDIEYTISDHIKYIDKFIETLKLDRIILVMHGWGSIIGFDYAMRHENKCKGLVFYEAYLRSVNGDDISLPYQEQMLALQGEENINDLVLNGALFIDKVLPQSGMRLLSEKEMNHYREPFKQKGSGKPLSQYLRELPTEKNHGAITKLISDYSKKLTQSQLPKLMLYSVPGFITTMATVMWAKENLPNIEIIDVGEELHYIQESDPAAMGESISIWLQAIEQMEGL